MTVLDLGGDYRAWLVAGVAVGLVMVLLGIAGLVYAHRDHTRVLDEHTRIEVLRVIRRHVHRRHCSRGVVDPEHCYGSCTQTAYWSARELADRGHIGGAA